MGRGHAMVASRQHFQTSSALSHMDLTASSIAARRVHALRRSLAFPIYLSQRPITSIREGIQAHCGRTTVAAGGQGQSPSAAVWLADALNRLTRIWCSWRLKRVWLMRAMRRIGVDVVGATLRKRIRVCISRTMRCSRGYAKRMNDLSNGYMK
jgi:hypothetical protein